MVSFLHLNYCVFILLLCKVYVDGLGTATPEPNVEKTHDEGSDETHFHINDSGKNGNQRNSVAEDNQNFNTKGTCPPARYSCKSDLPSGTERLCNCDEKCILYKDCCTDSEYYNLHSMSEPTSYDCRSLMYNNLTLTTAFVKKDCHPDWKVNDISSKCYEGERNNIDSNIIKLYGNVPATGTKTNITYRNWFCAICNFEVSDEIFVWMNVTLNPCVLQKTNDLTEMLDLNTVNDTEKNLKFNGLRWYYTNEGATYFCDSGYVYVPEDVKSILDGCFPYVPLQNSTTCSNADDRKTNCSSTFALMMTESPYETIYFRNEYCFLCSDRISKKTCPAIHLSLNRTCQTILNTNQKSMGGRTFTILFSRAHSMEVSSTLGNSSSTITVVFQWYTTISLFVSSMFLCVHLVVYAISKKPESIGEKNLASFCLALLLAYCSFLVGNYTSGSFCLVISSCTYYFFLTSFTWLFTITYDLTRMVWKSTKRYRVSQNRKSLFLIYTIINWVICLIPTLTLVHLDLSQSRSQLAPHFSSDIEGCWFHNPFSLLYFFILPLLSIIVVNFLMFSCTTYLICTNKFKSTNENKDIIAKYMLYVRLALLCGLTWLSIFFAIYFDNWVLWFGFTILNTGQGVFIFIVFTLRKGSKETVTRITATS